MKGILRYLKGYKKESILAPLFKMLEATFELLIPIVMANVIDVGIACHKLRCEDVSRHDTFGNYRSGVFYHRPVFFGKGCYRIWNSTSK